MIQAGPRIDAGSLSNYFQGQLRLHSGGL